MTATLVRDEGDRSRLIQLIRNRKIPFTANLKQGLDRSHDQNRLMWLWHQEASEQLGDETPTEKHAEAKLNIALPILMGHDDAFREAYNDHVRGMPYERQLRAMMPPIDFPVTRYMSTKAFSQFLDELQAHYRSLGVRLTDPEAMGL